MSTPEEYKSLIQSLHEARVKPKSKDPKQFKKRMKTFVEEDKEEETIKEESESGVSSHTPLPYTRHPPMVSFFSGKEGKSDTSYDLWRYEVCCLMADKIHPQDVIAQAVRRSLRGDAGRVLMHLGTNVSLEKMIEKMDSIFGKIYDGVSVMTEFYSASQKDEENVTTWSCRLENIIDKAIQMDKVKRHEADSMLSFMLFTGLSPQLRDIYSIHYVKDKCTSFDQLRVALRKLEKDFQSNNPHHKPKQQISKKDIINPEDETDDDGDDIKGMIQQINARLDALEANSLNRENYRQNNRRPRGRGNFQRQQSEQYQDYRGSRDPNSYWPETCRKCGQLGHIAFGCRAKVNTNNTTLKYL